MRDLKDTPAEVRCAVYTRKSTDEGLQQDFNSLDAQREAGEAYVASQKGAKGGSGGLGVGRLDGPDGAGDRCERGSTLTVEGSTAVTASAVSVLEGAEALEVL